MSVNPDLIEPARLYSLREATHFIPSLRGEGTIHLRTLRRWKAEGKIQTVRVSHAWFVYGSELLRFLRVNEAPVWEGRTPAARGREVSAAEARMSERRTRRQEAGRKKGR